MLGPIKLSGKIDPHTRNIRSSQDCKMHAEVQRDLLGFRKELGARAPWAAREERPSVLSLRRNASFGSIAVSLRKCKTPEGRSGKTTSLESAKKQQSGQWCRSPLFFSGVVLVRVNPAFSRNSPA